MPANRGRIDREQVLLLAKTTLRAEWRTPTIAYQRGKTNKSWAIWNLVSYAFIGAVIAGLFWKHGYEEQYLVCTSIFATYLILISASNTLLSFGSGFMQPDEMRILLPLPISDKTFFVSRIAVLLVYSLVVGFAV